MPHLRRESVAARVEEELRAAAARADKEHAATKAREELRRVQRLVARGKWRHALAACSSLTDEVSRAVVYEQKARSGRAGSR